MGCNCAKEQRVLSSELLKWLLLQTLAQHCISVVSRCCVRPHRPVFLLRKSKSFEARPELVGPENRLGLQEERIERRSRVKGEITSALILDTTRHTI